VELKKLPMVVEMHLVNKQEVEHEWGLLHDSEIYDFFTRYTLMSYYYTYYYNRHIGEHYVRLLRSFTTEDSMYNTGIANKRITTKERRVAKTYRSTGKVISTTI